jgi:hypothetical protein
MHPFKKSKFSLKWEGPFQEVNILFTTPDFEALTPEVWGDIGPNYGFQLTEADPFRIQYQTQYDIKEFHLHHVTLATPFSLEKREKYPFQLNIEDNDHNFFSQVFFDQSGIIVDAATTYQFDSFMVQPNITHAQENLRC